MAMDRRSLLTTTLAPRFYAAANTTNRRVRYGISLRLINSINTVNYCSLHPAWIALVVLGSAVFRMRSSQISDSHSQLRSMRCQSSAVAIGRRNLPWPCILDIRACRRGAYGRARKPNIPLELLLKRDTPGQIILANSSNHALGLGPRVASIKV